MKENIRFSLKWTSELSPEEIGQIITVLNTTFGHWGHEEQFRWKFSDNTYGESLHLLAFDGDLAVASVAFWRNDTNGAPAYQCCDAAIVPSHQRQGIFHNAVSACVNILEGSSLYSFPNDASLPVFLQLGWQPLRQTPLGFHLAPFVLSRYESWDPVPDEYVKWRFVGNPNGQYYVHHRKQQRYLLSKRRSNYYVVIGKISEEFDFPKARPIFLFSQDIPDLRFRIPGRRSTVIGNSAYVDHEVFIPSYRDDTL